MINILKKIFSITSVEFDNKIYKQIIIFGIRFKFLNKYKTIFRRFEILKNDSKCMANKINQNFEIQNKKISEIISQNVFIENLLNKNSYDMAWGLIDGVNGSFRKYFIKNNMVEKIDQFKKNLDEKSLKIFDRVMEKILYLPDETVSKYCNIDIKAFKYYYDDYNERNFTKLLEENEKIIKQSYKLSKPNYDMEVFLYHHGLKNLNEKFYAYLKNKDFIDAGAYIGDSALVLLEYKPNCIHSFEISKDHCKNYYLTMQLNNINPDKYKLNNLGLHSEIDTFRINDYGEMGKKLYNGTGEKVDVLPLDIYVENNNCNVGFIKADIEGSMYKALQGMVNTIKRFRPVLSFAIYHTGEEFFDTKILLDKIIADLNYTIKLETHFPESTHIYGTILFAYPKELN